MQTQSNTNSNPVGFKHFAVGFLAGALFVFPAFLFMCAQNVRHGQSEVSLRNQLLPEHYNNQAMTPAVPDFGPILRDRSGFEGNLILVHSPLQPIRIPKYPPAITARGPVPYYLCRKP